MLPKLSIIIPCFNNGKYLIEMLDCFLNQTSNNWEIIVVDDISTDDTASLIKTYTKIDPRIKFYVRDREPKGSVVCRNIGFDKSEGKYICHLDADDLVSDTFVEHRVRFMEDHPEIDYASFCAKEFNDGDKSLPMFNSSKRAYGIKVQTHDLLEDFLSAKYSFSVWNNIYRKESIKEMFWDENVKIYTDFSFILPCILKGLRHAFSNLAEVDYYYRKFPNKKNSISMSSNYISDDKCLSTIYLFNKIIKSLSYSNDFVNRKQQFLKFVILHFERLMKGKKQVQILQFMEFIRKNYPDNLSMFERIYLKCMKINNTKLYEPCLYWYLLNKFKDSRYKQSLSHSIVKLLIGR